MRHCRSFEYAVFLAQLTYLTLMFKLPTSTHCTQTYAEHANLRKNTRNGITQTYGGVRAVKIEQLCQVCSLTGQTLTPSRESLAARLPSVHACMVKMESELYVCTQHVSTFHTHISVSEVGSWSVWGAYPGVLSDTPTECVTQCVIVPCLKQNTRHHASCTKQDMCMKPNIIPLTPQGHFVPQLYHRTARGLSSLKTSS